MIRRIVTGAALLTATLVGPLGLAQGGPAPPGVSSSYGPNASGPQLVVRNAADALGMIRGVGPGESLDVINRLQFSATGSVLAGNTLAPAKETVGVSLHQWAARVDQEIGAPPQSVHRIDVVAGPLAWNEKTPGGEATAAAKAAEERGLEIKLLPQGFLRAVILADPVQVTVGHDEGGATITLTGKPYTLEASLDAQYRPSKIQAWRGHTLVREVDYNTYKDFDEYEVYFPTHIVEKRDGRVIADLTVTEFHTAAYVVFPIPAGVRGRAN